MFVSPIPHSQKPALPCIFPTLILVACGGGGSETTASQGSASTKGQSAQFNEPNLSSNEGSLASPDRFPGHRDTSAPSASPDAPAVPSQPTPPSSNTKSTIIDYYGDSTVYGYATGLGGQVAEPAPAAFAAALPASPAHEVRNEGVSATTACQLLRGTDGVHPEWSQQMASSNAGYVIINHAINDQWRDDLSTYKSCLRQLAQIAKQNGKQVIFETPNPTMHSGASLDHYVRGMKDVATEQNVPIIDQYTYLLNHLAGRSPYTICPDGLHPTDAVYTMKGQFAAGEFMKLFPVN